MRKLLLTLFFILFAFPVYALELLMAHNPSCHICEKFIKEVAIDYNDSEVAKKLPLIVINVYEQPEWFKEAYRIGKIKPIRGTPTFIVWNGSHEGGHEIARLVGYHDKQRFYSRLKKMLSIED
jgi:thioredoxin-related protein